MSNPFRDWTPQMVDAFNQRESVTVLSKLGKPCAADAFGKKLEALANKPTKRKPLLNKTETRFLDLLKAQYPGRSIGIQSITFKLAFDCRYTPDFWLVPDHVNDCDIPPSNTALLRFYEVKGPFIREDGMVKLKAAAALFPMFDFVIAQWKDGEWASKTIRPQ